MVGRIASLLMSHSLRELMPAWFVHELGTGSRTKQAYFGTDGESVGHGRDAIHRISWAYDALDNETSVRRYRTDGTLIDE